MRIAQRKGGFTMEITEECPWNQDTAQQLAHNEVAKFEAVWSRVMDGKPNPIVSARVKAKERPAPKQEEKYPCFGEESAQDFLKQAVKSCLEALEDFRKLEKQLPQKLKPAVQTLTTARKKQLNQLDTAYFLLTGQQASPPMTLEQSAPVPADQRLRHRFRQAQQWQGLFQKQAFTTEDACLTTLFLNLEMAMKEELTRLHSLVEAVFWMKQA